MPAALTTLQVASRIKDAHPHIRLISEYTLTEEPIKLKCRTCKNIWDSKFFNVLKSKIGCPVCANKVVGGRISKGRVTHEEIIERLSKATNGTVQLLETYTRYGHKHKMKCLLCEAVFKRRLAGYFNNVSEGCVNCKGVGNFSRVAIHWLNNLSKDLTIKIRHAGNSSEKRISISTQRTLSVDGYCKESKLVFEFLGDEFHGNPTTQKPASHCHPFKKQFTARKLHEQTFWRHAELVAKGYSVVYLWASDYRKGKRVSGVALASKGILPKKLLGLMA